MEKVRYTISDAAQMMDVESHALRYWEEELDLSVPRNEQGHRYYTKENIEQFQKIKDLKEKGYQLKAIKMLLHEEQPLLETEPQPKEKRRQRKNHRFRRQQHSLRWRRSRISQNSVYRAVKSGQMKRWNSFRI